MYLVELPITLIIVIAVATLIGMSFSRKAVQDSKKGSEKL